MIDIAETVFLVGGHAHLDKFLELIGDRIVNQFQALFGITDFVVANVLPPINALLIALFVGWVFKSNVIDEEFAGDSRGWKRYWRFVIRYVAPFALLIVLVDFVTS